MINYKEIAAITNCKLMVTAKLHVQKESRSQHILTKRSGFILKYEWPIGLAFKLDYK